MAACLVTVSGTSGSVLIQYVDGSSVSHSIISDITTSLYISDTGSDYTFTTLSGDAIASSGCVTLTEIEINHYILSWEIVRTVPQRSVGQVFDAVVIGSTTTPIDEVSFPYDPSLDVIKSINALNLPNIKATGYKIVDDTDITVPLQYFVILKVTGTDIPYIRISNSDASHNIFLKGVYTATALPAGYTAVDVCEIGSTLL